ncbi:PfkB family carbohydrate kinase [Actinomadura rayongensis]|uniref:Ribokinase n=1 Tax=Actinomadura rayongensis TaxID=1429076 RepID=A0A6I4WET0_9ACTN|nr:PfkB family carbohydrate kinase [Actinomadura rayongensis]MXQ68328.1 ribokinase [Actinomadura rayongensis]
MIAVVGSLNQDLTVAVRRLPAPGETVPGGPPVARPGGKGANQAVAAARAGGTVTMIGRVGDDPEGTAMIASLRAEGVDTAHVRLTAGVPTGRALITVDEHGENSIVVSPGANGSVTALDVEAAAPVLRRADVTLFQREVPDAAGRTAARLSGGLILYNPAPADVTGDIPPGTDLVIPNRVELATLARTPVPATLDQVVAAARRLTHRADFVVTLGGDGVLLIDAASHLHLPAFPIVPIDTTAAGDTFCGALAVALAEGRDLRAAARWAAAAAALSTTRRGALSSSPSRAEIETLARSRATRR